jgi:hypothetical protein
MTVLHRLLLACLVVCWGILLLACGGVTKSSTTVPTARSSADAQKPVQSGNLPVEVVNIRLEPFRAATGVETKMVHTDWKNPGDRTVRSVFANINAFDDNDKELYSAKNYCIYATSNDAAGVAPGDTYTAPNDAGHVLPKTPGVIPTRVTVVITRVEEKGY